MKVLVTGGAGFIGSNLVEELVRLGEDVLVLDDFSTGSLENLKAVQNKVKIVPTSCQRLLELKLPEIKKIFHLGIPSSSPMYRDNPALVGEAIGGFINVFELARRNRARVVYASTSSLYRGCPTPHREDRISEPFDFYTEARIAMERLARVYYELHGVSSVGMRFFSVYGPHERAKGRYANNISQFLWAMREDKPPEIYGDGEQTRDFVHVSDVLRACLMAADSDLGCEVVNVGTGRQTSFNRVIELLNKALGKEIKPVYVPNPIKNYVYHTCADLTRAKKLLGYGPMVSLEEGISSLVALRE
ncbi:MAG: NAD-dependent epimerase/dehydratase family protein [Candidatus Hadarchaeaceae archaeon]